MASSACRCNCCRFDVRVAVLGGAAKTVSFLAFLRDDFLTTGVTLGAKTVVFFTFLAEFFAEDTEFLLWLVEVVASVRLTFDLEDLEADDLADFFTILAGDLNLAGEEDENVVGKTILCVSWYFWTFLLVDGLLENVALVDFSVFLRLVVDFFDFLLVSVGVVLVTSEKKSSQLYSSGMAVLRKISEKGSGRESLKRKKKQVKTWKNVVKDPKLLIYSL